jgi:ATP-dependent Clp protease ATP-binding subunit ClpA
VGMTLEGTREQVAAIVDPGTGEPRGHIPFTPRAKKILELSLREAHALHSNYIGTEHILLGLLREGDGVAAQVLRSHADLLAIRVSVLDHLPSGEAEDAGSTGGARTTTGAAVRRRVRDLLTGGREAAPEQEVGGGRAGGFTAAATPAADATLAEAARLAEGALVGSHHLLLAALADPDSAAARVFARLGVDLDRAKEALRTADVTGTSDELPEEAGRRQMSVQVTGERLTIVLTDPVIVAAGKAALTALQEGSPSGQQAVGEGTGSGAAGDETAGGGTAGTETAGSEAGGGEDTAEALAAATTIRGDHPAAASLAAVWRALYASLTGIADTERPAAAA